MALLSEELDILAPTFVPDLIRLGNKGDGGYVLPKSAVDSSDFLISMGINTDWSFDRDFLQQNPNIGIHAYDHTISAKRFKKNIKKPVFRMLYGKAKLQDVLYHYRLYKSYMNFFRGRVTHFQERIHNRLDHAFDVTLDIMMGRVESASIVLKVDIEGSEYRIIDDIIRHSGRVIAVIIEFHNTEPHRKIFLNSIEKLKNVFELVHIHGNNYDALAGDGLPEVLELSFVNKTQKQQNSRKRIEFPIPNLDYPNNPNKDDYKFSFRP
jgi:hypothetical protein